MAAEKYRKLAAELRVKARKEQRPQIRAELNHLAHSYVRLAEQAERNARCDVTYKPGSEFNLGGEPA